MSLRAWQLLLAEEMQKERVVERVIYEPKPVIQEQKQPKELINSSVLTVKRKERVIYFTDGGEVVELTLILNNPSAKIILVADGGVVLNKTLNELLQLSKYVSWITATDYGGKYVFSIKEFKFDEEFRVYVDPDVETEVELFYVVRVNEE